MGTTKAELRQRIRAQRPGDSTGLLEQLIALAGEANTVASFSPLPTEPDVSQFNDWVVRTGRRLLLPEIAGQQLIWREPGALIPGRFGVPSPTGEPGFLVDAALALVPALAVDRAGVRLGQGGGYYDRALGELVAKGGNRPRLVAVVFDHELVEELPSEPHDVLVDAAVSPRRIWRFEDH